MLKKTSSFAETNITLMYDEHATAQKVASALLQINAIKLNTKNPFTWVSGIRSPIYCDNRQILSYPGIRRMVAAELVALINREYPDCEVVAGVATGAIAHGMLVADKMDKPFIYVRSSAKGHGLENRIEGKVTSGAAVVVVEDLVSTGKSSLEAVYALRAAGLHVLGMAAIFSYELPKAIESMKEARCSLLALSNFTALSLQAKNEKLITAEEAEVLSLWRQDPENY